MTDPVSSTLQRVNPTPQASAAATPDSGALSSDFDTFLNLLTAQLENQDPLAPTDSTEWVAQLATFSSVEQQTLTNDWLEVMSGQMSVTSMAELGVWIGMEAQVVADAYWNGADPVTVMPNPPVIADRVDMVVYGPDGDVISRREIPVSADPASWDGMDSFGSPAPVGSYKIEIESFAGGDLISVDNGEIFASVKEVRSVGGQAVLVMEGGTTVQAAEVLAVREPPSTTL